MSSASQTQVLRWEQTDKIHCSLRAHLTVFAFLWGAFTLFHQAKSGYWAQTPLEVLQTFCALAILLRPSSVHNLLALTLVQFALLISLFPLASNHSTFALFVNWTILAGAAAQLISRLRTPIDGARLFATFAPVVRIEVILLYCFVVFHKLNTDFLEPYSSCAVDHYNHLAGMISRVLGRALLPEADFMSYVAVWGTLVIEAAIPVLLIVSRTRALGILLGLIFHYILGVNKFHDFSGMMFALLFLFAPANTPELVSSWWGRAKNWLTGWPSLRKLPSHVLPARIWVALAAIVLLAGIENSWTPLFKVFLVAWAVYGLILTVIYVFAVLPGRPLIEPSAKMFAVRTPWLMIIPILVIINGLCPYVGLKTRGAFAMFSNVRTEAGVSNHLIVPASWQIFEYQRDIVRIHGSSDPHLASLADEQLAIPFFYLRDYVSSRAKGGRPTHIDYSRNGMDKVTTNAEADSELGIPYPLLLRKLLIFSAFATGPRQHCRH